MQELILWTDSVVRLMADGYPESSNHVWTVIFSTVIIPTLSHQKNISNTANQCHLGTAYTTILSPPAVEGHVISKDSLMWQHVRLGRLEARHSVT